LHIHYIPDRTVRDVDMDILLPSQQEMVTCVDLCTLTIDEFTIISRPY